ncbi:MAG: hypothetical protein ACHREM_15855 [Polyangiales bacterium]
MTSAERKETWPAASGAATGATMHRTPRARFLLAIVAATSLAVCAAASSCAKGAPPASMLDGGNGSASVTETITGAGSTSAVASTSTSVSGSTEAPVDDLQARAKKLFEAIQKDEPDLAMDLFFPRDPYLAMKDVKDPAASWDKLAKDYKLRIHSFHKQLGKKPGDAEFDTLELNTKSQVYVAPKKELNKTGYNRVSKNKLRYKLKGKPHSFEIAMMIDSDGKWYVLHLK